MPIIFANIKATLSWNQVNKLARIADTAGFVPDSDIPDGRPRKINVVEKYLRDRGLSAIRRLDDPDDS